MSKSNDAAFHALRRLPKRIGVPIYLAMLRVRDRSNIVITQNKEDWLVKNNKSGESYYFPNYPHLFQIEKVLNGYRELMIEKYTKKDFVEINSEDTVVDIGAFVGGFSLGASNIASKVIAIEPTPKTYKCLNKNINDEYNICAKNCLVGSNNKKVDFKLAKDPSDNSVLEVDSTITGKIKIQQLKLSDIISDNSIDFLKLDAEGAEPEVLDGCDIGIRKFAIDTGPERYGEKTTKSVIRKLEKWGFETQNAGNMVYAKV